MNVLQETRIIPSGGLSHRLYAPYKMILASIVLIALLPISPDSIAGGKNFPSFQKMFVIDTDVIRLEETVEVGNIDESDAVTVASVELGPFPFRITVPVSTFTDISVNHGARAVSRLFVNGEIYSFNEFFPGSRLAQQLNSNDNFLRATVAQEYVLDLQPNETHLIQMKSFGDGISPNDARVFAGHTGFRFSVMADQREIKRANRRHKKDHKW